VAAGGRLTALGVLDIEVEPAAVGLDAGRLGRLDAFLTATLTAGRIPGWVLAVSRSGQLAHVSIAGERDLEAGWPVEPDTLFRIYSMTKPITAVAALILYERGAFELSDPVARFIPSFADMRVFTGGSDLRPVTEPATRPITMWHLLTHTSGLTYGFHRAHPVDALYRQAGHEIEAPDGTLAESCDTWARLPLLFQPGTEWNYSVATDVVGQVVEVISGQSLGEFCAQNIFDPLGMIDTAFTVVDSDADRLARLYLATPSGGLTPSDALGATVRRPDRAHYGGGGLVSTAADYLRFATMLLGRGAFGAVRILGPRTVDFMTRNHLPGGVDLAQFGRPMNAESPLAGVGQGLGMSVVLDPVRAGFLTSPGEFGWGGAASTVFWVDPELELVVVLMTQVLPAVALPIRNLLHQLVHQAVLD
jgi:CubicO group peptidase (beta-lactamase class C family)